MASQTVPVCDGCAWTNVVVVKSTPSFDPVAWFQGGDGMQSTEAEAYIKGQLLPGVTVPLVLLGFTLMALLFFVVWRLCNMCGCCEPDEDDNALAHRHGAAMHLKHPMMKAQQVAVVVFALAAWGMAIYGMVKLPKDASVVLFGKMGEVTQYADSVAFQVDVTLDGVRGINGSLGGVQGVLDVDVDAPGIIAGLEAITPFVTGIQDPAAMTEAFAALNVTRKTTLPRQLTTLIKLANETLGQLLPSAVQVGSLADLSPIITNTFTSYFRSLQSLPTQESFMSSAGQLLELVQAQQAMQPAEWQANVTAAARGLDQLEAERLAGLLPRVTSACDVLVSTQNTMAGDVQALMAGLTFYQSLDPEALGAALSSLASRLQHINSTVVVLNQDTQRSYDLINLALSALTDLGLTANLSNSNNSDNSSAALARGNAMQALGQWQGQLQGLNRTLVGNSERVGQLRDAVASPQQQLEMAPDATSAKQVLADLGAQLGEVAPLVQAVGDALRAHLRQPDADTYAALIQQRDRVLAVQDQVQAVLATFESDSAQQYLQQVKIFTTNASAVSDEAAAAASDAADALVRLGVDADLDTSRLGSGLASISQVYASLPQPATQVVEWPRQLLDSALQQAEDGMAGVRQQIQSALDQVSYHMDDFHAHLDDLELQKQEQQELWAKRWTYVYNGLMAGYGTVIFLLLVLMGVVLLRCPAGVVLTTFLLLVGLVLWLLVALCTMAGMVVLQDGCHQVEAIIVRQVSEHTVAAALVEYYLFRTGNSLKDVLRLAAVVDVDKVLSGMTSSLNTLLDSLQSKWVVQPGLSNALMNVTGSVENAQMMINNAVALLEYGPVHGLYVEFKSYVCCDVGTQLLVAWICITASGLLALLAAWAAKSVLSRLDMLPRDDCMGCQCYKVADHEPPSRAMRRRFWGSWGGNGGSSGGVTAIASIGGASSVADCPPDMVVVDEGGVLVLRPRPRQPYGSAAGASSALGSSSGGSSSSSAGGAAAAARSRQQRRHPLAWWRLVNGSSAGGGAMGVPAAGVASFPQAAMATQDPEVVVVHMPPMERGGSGGAAEVQMAAAAAGIAGAVAVVRAVSLPLPAPPPALQSVPSAPPLVEELQPARSGAAAGSSSAGTAPAPAAAVAKGADLPVGIMPDSPDPSTPGEVSGAGAAPGAGAGAGAQQRGSSMYAWPTPPVRDLSVEVPQAPAGLQLDARLSTGCTPVDEQPPQLQQQQAGADAASYLPGQPIHPREPGAWATWAPPIDTPVGTPRQPEPDAPGTPAPGAGHGAV